MLTILSQTEILGRMPSELWPAEILWPDEVAGPWRVTVWWRIQHGVAEPVGFALRSWIENELAHLNWRDALPMPNDDAEFPAVGSQLMKALPMGRIVEATRGRLQDELGSSVSTGDGASLGAWQRALDEIRQEFVESTEGMGRALQQPVTGRDLGDDHYREVARVYALAVQAGRPPTVAVAEHFTVSKSAAAKKVARARDRGFLPKTSRGRVGRLTEEL